MTSDDAGLGSGLSQPRYVCLVCGLAHPSLESLGDCARAHEHDSTTTTRLTNGTWWDNDW